MSDSFPFRRFVIRNSVVHGLLFGLAGILVSAFQQAPVWPAIVASALVGVVIALIRAPGVFHKEIRLVCNEVIRQTTLAFMRRSYQAGLPLDDLQELHNEVLREARRTLRSRTFMTINAEQELAAEALPEIRHSTPDDCAT
ncbi:MAG TPA: hypothetical protein PKE27_00050 [Povalibacter sp.]|uniref:hypothetical protein n=1 Tax=Povalibacter sp. TaxID=1962978 RepID=UPI002B7DA070|nr:hypothetical protein [Povalibacter sp.]HMN42937.1 hypothetical protein [Povalibacter sp.]